MRVELERLSHQAYELRGSLSNYDQSEPHDLPFKAYWPPAIRQKVGGSMIVATNVLSAAQDRIQDKHLH